MEARSSEVDELGLEFTEGVGGGTGDREGLNDVVG